MSCSRGQSRDVPLNPPQTLRLIPMPFETWAARYQPFKGLPWSSWVKNIDIDFVVSGTFTDLVVLTVGHHSSVYPLLCLVWTTL
jgi:hypothetical protein